MSAPLVVSVGAVGHSMILWLPGAFLSGKNLHVLLVNKLVCMMRMVPDLNSNPGFGLSNPKL